MNLRMAGLAESDIKIVEKYSPHRSPRKMSGEHEEEVLVQEEEKVEVEVEAVHHEEEEVSPTRLRLTKEEYLKHSAPA